VPAVRKTVTPLEIAIVGIQNVGFPVATSADEPIAGKVARTVEARATFFYSDAD